MCSKEGVKKEESGCKAERTGRADNTLPKSIIISKKRCFDDLFSRGRRLRGTLGQLIVHPCSETRVAFVVGKKVGSAVVRNTLKRYVREYYRTHKALIPDHLAVVFQIFPGSSLPGYHDIASEFTDLCQKL